MLRLLSAACLTVSSALLLSSTVLAQRVPPNAGQSIREIERTQPELPAPDSLNLTVPTPAVPTDSTQGPRVRVTDFRITGNTSLTTETLQALLADFRGRELTHGQLQEAALRLTEAYRKRGYLLARAYLPAQRIENGVVDIAVLEGRLGDVRINNDAKLAGNALAPLSRLQINDAVQASSLERSLLLMNDIPGISVASTLTPGALVGSTDILVDVQATPLVSGTIDADNFGNRYTGDYRLGGTFNLNNPLKLGDRLSLRALGTNEQQGYGRVAYQLPVGPWGTQIGASYSYLRYDLGDDFAALNAHGRASIASAFVMHPLLRQRDQSLYLQLQYDDKRLVDDIDYFGSRSDRHVGLWSVGLNGNSRDNVFGGGVNGAGLIWGHGDLSINGAANQALDQATARSAGSFNKLNASLVRLQRLTDKFSLYGQLQGQWADRNLDSSEKMSLGGAYGVRAYPQGDANGDEGWLGNIELRYAITPTWQVMGFLDHGEVKVNKSPWAAGTNRLTRSGAGVGASWTDDGWRASVSVAWKIGSAQDSSNSGGNPRIWAALSRAF